MVLPISLHTKHGPFLCSCGELLSTVILNNEVFCSSYYRVEFLQLL